MTHDEFETLAAVYAAGALDGEDLARFEAHLADGCAACAASLRAHDETLARLAIAGPRGIPPAHVREALLARLDATAPRPRPAPRRWLPRAAAIAAGMLITAALGAGFMAAHYEARLGSAAREMAAMRARIARDQEALRAELAPYAAVVELLRDPATQVVALRGTGAHPDAVGRVVWREATGGQILVANLPPAPAGKTYELWTITAGTPRPAGTFSTDASGSGRHAVAPAGRVDVFAVTLEPEGGVPAPTGPIVLASAKP
jgi:anti-sigma-K factor RskA